MREMRRKNQKLPEKECLRLLREGEYGVLATACAESGAYGVPLSYVWHNDAVYVHCAHEGRKVDNIRADSRVSFTVIGRTRPVYDINFTTCYESVIVGGDMEEVTDPDEKYAALYALAVKYLPEHADKAEASIKASFERTAVYALRPREVSGKAKQERKKQSG